MFELSLTIAVLMILTAAIPFSVQPRWACGLLCVAWLLVWGFVHLVNNVVRFVPAVGALYLFLIAAFPIARVMKLNWLGFQSIALVGTIGAYGLAMFHYIPAYREHQELRSRFPAVDLKPRLAEERPLLTASGPASAEIDVAGDVKAAPKYDARALREQDDVFRQYLDLNTFRIELAKKDRRLAFRALAQVHEGFVADFIAQPGVGRTRLPGVKLLRKDSFIEEVEDVRLDIPPEPIRQPDSLESSPLSAGRSHFPDEPPDAGSLHPAATFRAVSHITERPELESLHRHNVANFVPLYSLGGVDRDLKARGFEPHAFRLSPMQSDAVPRPTGWRLSRLELVSLLKHRPPAVYVSEHLPAMEELRTAPTRPTKPFESDAIARLIGGEDLVAGFSNEGDLAMVGSIRAIADCRECHQVPVGGLLGAFTYRLKPIPVAPAAVRQGEEPSPPSASPEP